MLFHVKIVIECLCGDLFELFLDLDHPLVHVLFDDERTRNLHFVTNMRKN